MGGSQWQQWFTPPVVVTGIFGTLSLQTAILWGLVGKIDQVNDRINQVRSDLSAAIRGLGDRIDQLYQLRLDEQP